MRCGKLGAHRATKYEYASTYTIPSHMRIYTRNCRVGAPIYPIEIALIISAYLKLNFIRLNTRSRYCRSLLFRIGLFARIFKAAYERFSSLTGGRSAKIANPAFSCVNTSRPPVGIQYVHPSRYLLVWKCHVDEFEFEFEFESNRIESTRRDVSNIHMRVCVPGYVYYTAGLPTCKVEWRGETTRSYASTWKLLHFRKNYSQPRSRTRSKGEKIYVGYA